MTNFHWKSALPGTAAGVKGRMKYTQMMAISATAMRFIHLYLAPLCHDPGWKASPIFHRSQIGMRKAR